jgi:hypothetical protein
MESVVLQFVNKLRTFVLEDVQSGLRLERSVYTAWQMGMETILIFPLQDLLKGMGARMNLLSGTLLFGSLLGNGHVVALLGVQFRGLGVVKNRKLIGSVSQVCVVRSFLMLFRFVVFC